MYNLFGNPSWGDDARTKERASERARERERERSCPKLKQNCSNVLVLTILRFIADISRPASQGRRRPRRGLAAGRAAAAGRRGRRHDHPYGKTHKALVYGYMCHYQHSYYITINIHTSCAEGALGMVPLGVDLT